VIKGVIFDLDGTLLDTIEDIADCVNTSLAQRGLPIHPAEDYKHMVGGGAITLIERALPKGTNLQVAQDILPEFETAYAKLYANKTRPYNGIERLLEGLHKQGVQIGVLSNKPDGFTKEMVRKFFKNVPFEFVLGATDKLPMKPDRAMFESVQGLLNLSPDNVAYLGDSDVDMIFAQNCGMIGVGAAWGFRGVDELEQSGAKLVLSSPEDLLNII